MNAASYTLRRTCPAQRHREDDFIVCRDGRDVGRLYRDTFAGEARWSWAIFIIDGLRHIDGVPISGQAESFAQAKQEFCVSYEKMTPPA